MFPALPDSFDARSFWSGLLSDILDQGDCGSCYAFPTATGLSDRISILLRKKIDTLSPQFIVSCSSSDSLQGCDGGTLSAAAAAVTNVPVPTLNQLSYQASASSRCPKGSYFATQNYSITSPVMGIQGAVEAMQREILTHGPITSQIRIFDDFMDAWDTSMVYSVYRHRYGQYQGGHAIKIVGWGTTDSQFGRVPYWIVANSWGQTGGINYSGYFYIQRGTNELGIELNGCECTSLTLSEAQTQDDQYTSSWSAWGSGSSSGSLTSNVFFILFLVLLSVVILVLILAGVRAWRNRRDAS